jgi:RNA polymerase sigma-70 factor (ECF subfamily)
LRSSTGARNGVGLIVLELDEDGICGMIRFEGTVLPWFGLPASLLSG